MDFHSSLKLLLALIALTEKSVLGLPKQSISLLGFVELTDSMDVSFGNPETPHLLHPETQHMTHPGSHQRDMVHSETNHTGDSHPETHQMERSHSEPNRMVWPKERFAAVTYHGDATFYSPSLGSCGRQSGNQDMIVAVSHTIYDSFWAGANPNSNPICGKHIRATYGSNSIDVVVVDRCTGCSHFDLDFSPGAFAKLGSPDQGRLHGMQWQFA